MYVPPGEEKQLKRFAIALSELPPRLVSKLTESFWVDSVVRPLVADNLAMNRPWYAGFARLMETVDRSNKVAFERKGLHAMIAKDAMCDPDGGAAMIQAIHEALRCRYGQIAEENRSSPTAMEKRWSGEYDRWRLAFAGAKTADQFRTALCDLFSRGGGNKVLRERWIELLPMLNRERWQLTRDLALLALPSYATSKE
jgi:CRISPR-associated protein Cas8a1/Csx13